ncbi:STARD3 N-terminal-like protein [Eucyclogobius newberryi]|uniref:STARD3 N-terminal-like protein n=1 Tax=Eucyclogobius newberryi TaxID=166745 RepID=UPI003B5998A6
MESVCSSSGVSRAELPVCINSRAPASLCSDLFKPKKTISDVRRTFCLFVTFDLLFISLLWIIELNGKDGLLQQLTEEVLHYDFHHSFFDIFLLAVFRFAALILAYAAFRLRHWAAIAMTTAVSCVFLIVKVLLSKLLSLGAFGYLLPIASFVLAWIETWLLDFKVLPQEDKDHTWFAGLVSGAERAPLLGPGPLSDGQFYSPPESVADSDEELEDKHEAEKGLIHPGP